MAHFPNGANLKTLHHFYQILDKKKPFSQFDHSGRLKRPFNKKEAPEKYHLSKIPKTFPIGLFCGQCDLICAPKDYKWLE